MTHALRPRRALLLATLATLAATASTPTPAPTPAPTPTPPPAQAAAPTPGERVVDAKPLVDPAPKAQPGRATSWPVVVEATLKIDRVGRTSGHALLGEATAADPFHAAVAGAIAGWSFWPALGACRHVEQDAKLRFAFDDEEVRLEGIAYTTTTPARAAPAEIAWLYASDPGDGRDRGLTYRPGFVETVPLKQVMPKYPASASRKAEIGYAFVLLEVGANGSVTKAESRDSWSSDPKLAPAFGAAAVAAVKQWKFKPATQDGKPIARSACQRFMFNMQLGGR